MYRVRLFKSAVGIQVSWNSRLAPRAIGALALPLSHITAR